MPAAIRSLPPPSKKRKLQKDSGFAQSIEQLEDQLTLAISNNSSLNPLADLLDFTVTASDPQHTSKVIYALYRVFVVIFTNGNLLGHGGDEAAKVVKSWIWDRLNEYVDFLGSLLKDEEKFLRTSSLQILFSLQKHLSTASTKAHSTGSSSSPAQPQFHISHFRKITSFLLLCPPSKRPAPQNQSHSDSNNHTDVGRINPDVLAIFLDTWFSVHDDIRWFFLREAATLLSMPPNASHLHLPSNVLSILESLTTFPTDHAELNSWWVAEMGSKPPAKSTRSESSAVGPDESEDDDDQPGGDDDDDDDWRKFFDDDTTKDPSINKAKSPVARLHKLTIHQSLHSLPSHRAVFTRAWLTLLPRLSLDPVQGKNGITSPSLSASPESSKTLMIRALNVMHRGVMPHLTRPVLIMDWVGASVDFGGTVGLLALNALFVLMKEYNLDYPSFYTRLYAFLDRDVLHLKHRARFFRMTELFLSSTHLPSILLASFIKRLARLSLSAPPAAIIMIIPFTYNILKRHPALMVMIHRSADSSSDFHTDSYLPTEPNPLLTQALSSSLWELNTHKDHYHSSVSTLAKIFSEAFTKPGYSMEDFLDHTYSTLFESEAKRKIKKEPALAIEMGKNLDLFPVGVDQDADGDGVLPAGDIISELWTFG